MKNGKLNLNLIIGIIIIGLMTLFVLIGIIYTPYDPNEMNGAIKNAAPTFMHPTIALARVDLPEPLSPTIPSTSP